MKKYHYMEQGLDESESDFRKRVNRFANSKKSSFIQPVIMSIRPFRLSATIEYYEHSPQAVIGKAVSTIGKTSSKMAKIIDFKGFKRGKK
ncbi:hypothetical protein [Streptococcus uberis]|uniref:hypothetical protein n=1 Tax=Streptococcus uberis TaxID=1349 RepID=UPI00215042A1|nr:hypothetical protein [Streptococcus uberis]MCR4257958.1 hypothetical protein [Streptococcus uberis]